MFKGNYIQDYSNPVYKGYRKKYLSSPKGKFSVYKSNARARGREFLLSFSQFNEIIASSCFFCGGDGFGIDRIDSDADYTMENCLPCCIVCNRMKSDFKIEEFINKCKQIAKKASL